MRYGGGSIPKTLPLGTVEDIKTEVMENIEIFTSARWICSPCHNMQPVTTTENNVAMYETIQK